MPNTKSAERRVRSNARKKEHNRDWKNRVRTAEKKFRGSLKGGKREECAELLRAVTSAYDRAVRSGVLHKGTADRKKSRLALTLNRTFAAAKK